jgi:hypothetical protein
MNSLGRLNLPQCLAEWCVARLIETSALKSWEKPNGAETSYFWLGLGFAREPRGDPSVHTILDSSLGEEVSAPALGAADVDTCSETDPCRIGAEHDTGAGKARAYELSFPIHR